MHEDVMAAADSGETKAKGPSEGTDLVESKVGSRLESFLKEFTRFHGVDSAC